MQLQIRMVSMDRLISVTTGIKFFFFISLVFFTACANKDVAKEAYADGNYKKATRIWKRWADVGYANAALSLAKMAQKHESTTNNDLLLRAKQAYGGGSKKAAFILEDYFIQRTKYKEALSWMKKGDLSLSNIKDIRNHLFLISHYINSFKKQLFYIKNIEQLAKDRNYDAAYALGNFFENSTQHFYNLNKSLQYYQLAYDDGNDKAGVALALLKIYKLNKQKEGVALLKEIASRGNANASLLIGNYFYAYMPTLLKKNNLGCATCNFVAPIDFYKKKLTLIQLRNLYLQKNVLPWYWYAYKHGSRNAMFALINLDIRYDTFSKEGQIHYSRMNLKQTLSYLNALSDKYFKAKMILAQLYICYPLLHKRKLAEQIYYEYMDINRTDAKWHLYQYYKKFVPTSSEKNILLSDLAAEDFFPAKIEYAYNTLLKNHDDNQSKRILHYGVMHNNTKAMAYMASLISKKIIPQKKKDNVCRLYKKICLLEPFNIKNDLKIASEYQQNKSNINVTKAATIYQFYAQQGDAKAQYLLSHLYKKFCAVKKELYWLKNAKKQGNEAALFSYNFLILNGTVKGDINKALEYIELKAKNGNIKAINVLTTLYATGEIVPFNPEKALQYYDILMDVTPKKALLGKITLLQRININHKLDKQIIKHYKILIDKGNESYKIQLAQFYMQNSKNSQAKRLLLSLPLQHYAQARYLLYKITGKMRYIDSKTITNNGNILLLYAKKYKKYETHKALLYAFRATLCNTQNSETILYELMRLINDSKTIENIFNNAKMYPRCTTQMKEKNQ